jgi:hypothetical protein
MNLENINDNSKKQAKFIEILNQELIKNEGNEFIKDQYKLIIDSAHKIAERAKDSNSIYITVNSIFIPFLIKFIDVELPNLTNIITFTCLIITGIIICFNWLSVIQAYGTVNRTNFLIIRVFEKYLPTSAFSLRAQLSDPSGEKGNSISYREKIIPCIFISMYIFLYIIFLVFFLARN